MYSQEEIISIIKTVRMPAGWSIDENGIYSETEHDKKRISATPLVIISQLINIKSEKVKYEIAYKVHGKWRTAVRNPDFFMSNKIVALAELGINVSSNNAVMLVRYLESLHKINEPVMKRGYLTDCMGWQTDTYFIPGAAGEIKLDLEDETKLIAEGFRRRGSLDTWTSFISKFRNNVKFRFMLAASAAAPLLKILDQRSFVLYNWGSSRSGKTAALKAALSIWGMPEEILGSFNTTQVGLEYMAALFNDLPLGLDERQLAGQLQFQQEKLENIVYMITSGRGRWRGKKDGGLQKVQFWRTIVIATGEEPIATSTSMTGVTTRIVELFGSPFAIEQDAIRMHQFLETSYGSAGEWLAHYYTTASKEYLRILFEKINETLAQFDPGGVHTASIAAVTLADAILESFLFNHSEDMIISENALKSSIEIAKIIIQDEKANSSNDVNVNAVQYLTDWILSNRNAFNDDNAGTRYGFADAENKIYYILPTYMEKELKRGGFSPRKTKAYMAEKGIIGTSANGDNKISFTVTKRRNGTHARYIEFRGLQDSENN